MATVQTVGIPEALHHLRRAAMIFKEAQSEANDEDKVRLAIFEAWTESIAARVEEMVGSG